MIVGQCRRAGGGRACPVRAPGMESGPAARRVSEIEAGHGGGLHGRAEVAAQRADTSQKYL